MQEKIALFGAGGKLGFRLTSNLRKSDYRVAHVEVSEAGQKRLKEELNVECVSIDAALDGAQVVILAVPDTLIGKLSHEIAPKLPAGTMVMTLDAAARVKAGINPGFVRNYKPVKDEDAQAWFEICRSKWLARPDPMSFERAV